MSISARPLLVLFTLSGMLLKRDGSLEPDDKWNADNVRIMFCPYSLSADCLLSRGCPMTEMIRNFIAGRWTDGAEGKRFASRNPSDAREVVAEAPLSGHDDVEQAVAAARAALPGWRM